MMDAPKGEWRKSASQYGSGDDFWLGSVKVGGVFYDATVPKGSTKRHRAAVLLPGITIKREASIHETSEEAQDVVERVVATWFRRLTV